METGFLKEWLSVAALFISVGGAIYAWLTARSKVNAEHLKHVDNTLADHGKRIQQLESEISHLPDKDTVMDLKLGIADLSGTVGRLDESLKGVGRTVTRIDDYLMKERT